MNELSRRPRGRPSRSAREQRAYRLVIAGSAAATVAVVGVLLALIGVMSFGFPVLAAIVAGICWLMFRRTVSP